MKKLFVVLTSLLVSVMSFGQSTDSTKTKLVVDGGVRFESLPYAPIASKTIGPNPVVIGILNASYGKFSTSYWASIDPFAKSGGDYHGLFTSFTQPIGKISVSLKNAHFFDYTFNKKFTSIFAVKVAGGNKLNWSVTPNYQVFSGRQARYIMMETVAYKSLKVIGWQISELGKVTTVAGVSWSSKPVKVSKHVSYSYDILWNHRISGSFVAPNTVSFGLNVNVK